ncbi:hypothetical protein ACF0H5_002242 [Mactra antiquata]
MSIIFHHDNVTVTSQQSLFNFFGSCIVVCDRLHRRCEDVAQFILLIHRRLIIDVTGCHDHLLAMKIVARKSTENTNMFENAAIFRRLIGDSGDVAANFLVVI